MADCPSFSNARQTVKGIRSKSKDWSCQVLVSSFFLLILILIFFFLYLPTEQAEEGVIYVGLSARMSERITLFDS